MEQHLNKQTHPLMKVLALIGLFFAFSFFSLLVSIFVILLKYGANAMDLLSSKDFSNPQVISILKITQFFAALIGMLGASLVYMKIFKKPSIANITYSPKPLSLIFYAMLVFFVAIPFIGFTNELNQLITLPKSFAGIENWMKDKEEQAKLLTQVFMKTNGAWDIIVAVIIMAVVPAISEEFLFRGALATIFKDWTKSIHWAAWISGIIFSAIHVQFYGFVPRFIMGVLLGYMFLWSGNIWLPVAAHFLNNFIAVISETLLKQSAATKEISDASAFDYPVAVILSILLTTILMIFVYKRTRLLSDSINFLR